MYHFEKKIIDAFISRCLAYIGKTGQNAVRLRSVSIYPEFDAAPPDEKQSYLAAAEALERKGILSLNWEKRGRGERLKTLACVNIEKLFEEAGGKDPQAEAEAIRVMIRNNIPRLEKMRANAESEAGNAPSADAASALAFLYRWADRLDSAGAGRGVDFKTAEDIVRLMEILLEPEKWANISTRALSVLLYRDSKRLEYLLGLRGPVLSQTAKGDAPPPDFSRLKRSLPETMITGKLIFEYRDKEVDAKQPMINAGGLMLGFPLPSAARIQNIRTLYPRARPTVLTIENKETFYAISDPQKYGYDCCLYSGGYPNQAAAALIKVLAASGFCFYHAGDLDPDGILILQNIADIAEKPVLPLRMDAATFDRYLPWARPLSAAMLGQIKRIRKVTRAIPALADLIRRIEETCRGVEQEIIDYRPLRYPEGIV
ncbi:MAG: DUF2220 domain-containing protein [Treponema sp.]|jgi:hypothetical protein|nr:DUF2220 domain-containing protein [Treponema sp.]